MTLHKAILCHVIIAILCLCCWSFPYLPAPLNVRETSRSQVNDVLRREHLDYIQRREINDDTGSGGGLEKWKGVSDDDDTGSGGGLGKWKGISDDDDAGSGGGLGKGKRISDDDDAGSGGGLDRNHDFSKSISVYGHKGSNKKPNISKSTGDDDEARLEGNNGVVFYGGHTNVHIKFPNNFGKKGKVILDNYERIIFDTKEMKGEQLQETIRRNAKSTETLKEASTAGLKSNTGQITRDVLEVAEHETWKQ